MSKPNNHQNNIVKRKRRTKKEMAEALAATGGKPSKKPVKPRMKRGLMKPPKVEGEMPYECTQCHKFFRSEDDMVSHQKTLHQAEFSDIVYNYAYDAVFEKYTCNTCDVECTNKEDIEKHVMIHEQKYSCDKCEKVFYHPYYFSTHVWEHKDKDAELNCPLCDYKAKYREYMRIHIHRMHLNKYLYTCDQCNKKFDSVLRYKEHMDHHVKGSTFECVVCLKKFPYSRSLLNHQNRCHRVYIEGVLLPNQCPICNMIFSSKAKEKGWLDKHMKQHEPKNLPHAKTHLCDICGKGYARNNKLEEHKMVHTGVKPHKCSYCGKAFRRREALTAHERIHSGEKPYSCEYCGKCFTQWTHLKKHTRSHTGERPFVCPVCTVGYNSKAALQNHMRTCSAPKVEFTTTKVEFAAENPIQTMSQQPLQLLQYN